jgi:hypothetical protein
MGEILRLALLAQDGHPWSDAQLKVEKSDPHPPVFAYLREYLNLRENFSDVRE